jgi:hypothetical protein
MADLGDLSDFLKDAAVSDLSWLDVNEEEYRKQDRLPMQNLDIAPDLQALWGHQDKPATAYKEKDHLPKTMGDLSEAHGHLRAAPLEIVRTARLALMQSPDLGRFKAALTARFDRDSLFASKTALTGVLAERGLLGPFYIEASDFPGCHNSPKKVLDFVRRFAGSAPFVVAKPECHGCIHAMRTPTGGSNCAVFHKELVVEVPYSPELAHKVEESQKARGKAVKASTATPKERIRLALLAGTVTADASTASAKPIVNPAQYMKPTVAPTPVVAKVDLTAAKHAAHAAVSSALGGGSITVGQAKDAFRAIASAADEMSLRDIEASAKGLPLPSRQVYVGAGQQSAPTVHSAAVVNEQLISAANLTKKRDEAANRAMAAHKAKPVLSFLRREMLKGRSEEELVQGLKLSFSVSDLAATREHWEPIFREAGLYGTLYSTQDSFDECREGSDFIAKHNPAIKVMVAGSKCDGCVYNKIGRCLLYGKPLVKDASETLTWGTVEAVLQEHKTAGRIAAWDATRTASWGQNPKEALKAIAKAATRKPGYAVAGGRLDAAMTAFHGSLPGHVTSSIVRRDIAKTAARYMNEGLYGKDLKLALKARFESRDLVAAKDDLKVVLAEQGLQGIYFIDPSVYDDYGKGCDEASRLFRAKGVQYVKAADKCGSCVHQRQAGICSKIAKPLVEEPPYMDKAAQQREVLASGRSTEISYESLTNNGLTMMAEYQLQNTGMAVDLNPVAEVPNVAIEFNTNSKIKL